MYLLVIIMMCCPSSGEGSVSQSIKPGVAEVMGGRKETAIPQFFHRSFPSQQKVGSAHSPLTLTFFYENDFVQFQ